MQSCTRTISARLRGFSNNKLTMVEMRLYQIASRYHRMEVSGRTILVCIMTLEAYASGIPLPRQFVAQGFNGQNEESSKLEDMMDLSKPALHTLLKGLAALLVQLYPDIMPKPSSSKEKKEEPIKIFRQIMQIPGPMFPPPPLPSMYPCQQMCSPDQMQRQQPTLLPQDPLQSPQIPPQEPPIQPPPEPRSQQYSPPQNNQMPEQCFPSGSFCQPNIEPQNNPFFPDQYNTC